jgi:DNA-binding CsgD family transcriptional regulator
MDRGQARAAAPAHALARDTSGKTLARQMNSYSTARAHIQSILAKLGAHSHLEAVALAVEHGLCDARPRPSARNGSESERIGERIALDG